MSSARPNLQGLPLAERFAPRFLSLRACWAYLRQISCLGLFFGIGLVVSPICVLLSRCFEVGSFVGQGLIRGLFDVWLCFSCRIGVFDISFPDAEQVPGTRGTVVGPKSSEPYRRRHSSLDCP